jgi:hypothetical protein
MTLMMVAVWLKFQPLKYTVELFYKGISRHEIVSMHSGRMRWNGDFIDYSNPLIYRAIQGIQGIIKT